jgi:hypothetical protein
MVWLTKKQPFALLLIATMYSSLTLSAFASQKTSTITIPHLEAPGISVDADLSESVWDKAVSVQINNITYPEENQPSPVVTTAKLFEDGETLYIGFIAKDPDPSKIRAYLRDRDSNDIWNDDIIGIKLDTYGDHKLAYQFWSNALGVQTDSIENAVTGRESAAWDAIWDSAGKVTDDGYVVEMALPLRILNFNDQLDKQKWAVELVRFYPRNNRQRISNMTIDPNNNCKVCQMVPLEGFIGAKQGKNLAVVPSLTIGTSESRDISSTPRTDWERESDIDVGLDIKWGITPDISLNATINPDFSQIEADVAQLSVNNTFSLFFPEKRAFFLDNADYFATPFDLVYTRNISDPDYGARLTGRVKEHSFGVFAANDTSTTVFVPGNIGSSLAFMSEESQNGVVRYRYDPSENLSVGWIGTFRSHDNYHNTVSGFDVKYKITENDDVTAQALYSDTEYPEDLYKDYFKEEDNNNCEILNCKYNEQVLRTKKDGSFTDTAYRFEYNHDERDWNFSTAYQSFGDDFRADLGFTNLVDWNKFVIGGNRIWRGEKDGWWSRFTIGGDWDITHNDNNELLEKESQLWINLDATSQSFLFLGITDRDRVGSRAREYELSVDGNSTLYHETQFGSYFSINLAGNLALSNTLDHGDEIDFANNRLGTSTFVRPTITWNPTKHITLRTRMTYKKLKAQGAEVFTAKLYDTRLTYQFSVRSFLRLATIYSDVDRNQTNYINSVNERNQGFSTQLLYSYKINPQTLFFVGYSDSAFADDQIDDLTRDSKTVFMKFSYAWLK